MTKTDKILEKMRNNPRDWQIADLEIIAERLGITVRQGKGSHVSFSHPKRVDILTVPAHRPVKQVYIKKFVSFIDALQQEGEI
jgi:predicted RNA binding protein YcfA (HicA-like mRNA interferase family)